MVLFSIVAVTAVMMTTAAMRWVGIVSIVVKQETAIYVNYHVACASEIRMECRLDDLVEIINKPIRIGWKGLSENTSNRIYENKGCSVGRFSH